MSWNIKQRWRPFIIWTIVILLVTTFGRSVQAVLHSTLDRSTLFGLILTINAAGIMVLLNLLRKKLRGALSVAIVLCASIAAALIAATLQRNPEEALHLFEYGLLSFFASRAIAPEKPDGASHVAAILFSASVGVFDELYQWILPSRIFDFRDITLNFIAASLVQLIIFAAQRSPALVSSHSLLRMGQSVALFALLIACCCALTPERIREIARRVPALGHLEQEPVIDFGFLNSAGPSVRFRSHFLATELEYLDKTEGDSVSTSLRAVIGSLDELSARYPELRYPYLHEVHVHVLRRNHYLEKLRENPHDRFALDIVRGEQIILERYFAKAAAYSPLDPPLRDIIVAAPPQSLPYLSTVQKNLLTLLTPAFTDLIARVVVFASIGTLLLLSFQLRTLDEK